MREFDKGAHGAERSGAIERARKALGARDLEALGQLCESNPRWFDSGWKEKTENGLALSTLALPEAARLGWAQGVRLLASRGADVERADDGRSGWGVGRVPLAEALSRLDFEVAAELLAAGARFEPLPEMVWAPSFAARKDIEKGLSVLKWMRARGFDLWGNDEAALGAESSFLFAGSTGQGFPKDKNKWDKALFEGCGKGPGARRCLWSHLYGSAHFGADADKSICELWLGYPGEAERPGRAKEMLRWALSGGAPGMGLSASEALFEQGADSAVSDAVSALMEACSSARGGARDEDQTAEFRGGRETFEALWTVGASALSGSGERLEAAARSAMASGQLGLLEALLDTAGVDPLSVARSLRESRSARPSAHRGAIPARGVPIVMPWDPIKAWEAGLVLLMAAEAFKKGPRGARDLFAMATGKTAAGSESSWDDLWAKAERKILASDQAKDARGAKRSPSSSSAPRL